ncbi:TPR repeat protein [Sesbania bispinosa]|nr:TPR repeat protein [Sesbania bispinosa]
MVFGLSTSQSRSPNLRLVTAVYLGSILRISDRSVFMCVLTLVEFVMFKLLSVYPSPVAFPSSGTAGINVDFTGSTASSQTPVQTSGGDPIDMFFTSSSASSGGAAAASQGFGGQPSSEMDDWGSTAKGKGMDNYKQG